MHTQFKRALAETPRDEWPKLQDEFGDLRVPLKDYEHRRADGTLVKPKDMYSINPWTAAVHSSRESHCPEMRSGVNKKYRKLALAMSDGTRAQVFVHSLCAFAAFGPRPNGQTVDHINQTETDNCFTNLRYASQSEQNLNQKTRDVSVRVPFNPEHTLPGENFRKYQPPGAKVHYLISNMRRVVLVSSSKMKTPWLIDFRDHDPKSYPKLWDRAVHDIVADLFNLGPDPANTVIMHKNNNSHDFTLSNLGIGTRSENANHAVQSNAVRTCPTVMCAYDAEKGTTGIRLANFGTYKEIEDVTGVTFGCRIIAGLSKWALTKMEGPTWRPRQCVTFIVDEEESDRLERDRKATKQKQLDDHLDFLASRRPVIRKHTIDGVLLNIYESMRDAKASIPNTSKCSQISDCIAGRCKSAYGYLWSAVHIDKLNNVIP